MRNAKTTREWFLQQGVGEHDFDRHWVAVTDQVAKAEAFGVAKEHIFPMWDWVGGALFSVVSHRIAGNAGRRRAAFP